MVEEKPKKRTPKAKKTEETETVEEKPKKRKSKAKKTEEIEEVDKPKAEEKTPKKAEPKVKKDRKSMPPSVNIGTAGHVDEGKSTLIKLLTDSFPDTHSEELKRGITIRLGYADCDILKCPTCPEPDCWTVDDYCPKCGSETEVIRRVSFVDAPGHEILMQVMMSGAAIMDGVMLVIAANSTVPQPQTREHLAALTALGVEKIVIVQNKIDLISSDEAMINYQQIKEFVQGTIAENAPIVPMSAMHGANLDILLAALQEFIPDPDRDLEAPMRMHVARSFDINRPGTDPKRIRGGVLGGSVYQGKMNVDDDIVILPGLKKKVGKKTIFRPVKTQVKSINLGSFGRSKSATPGGLLGIQTTIDPSMARSDSLSGSIIAAYKEGEELPPVVSELELAVNLFDNVVGAEEHITVKPLIRNEKLLLTIGTATAVCNVSDILKKGKILVDVNPQIAILPETKIAISRNFNKRWRLIGWAEIVDYKEIEIKVIT